MELVETRYGAMEVVDAKTDLIGSFLLRYGEWADLELRFVADNIKAGAAVADVGAFIGTFGIGLSQRITINKIVFVEGNKAVQPSLVGNVARNCKSSFVVVEKFLIPKADIEYVAAYDEGNLGSLSLAPEAMKSTRVVAERLFETIRMTDFWADNGPFDLLKLDVEGLERRLLQEIPDILQNQKLTIWTECNEDIASLELADHLLIAGFDLYYFAFPSFNRNNFNRVDVPIFPLAYEAGLLAIKGPVHFSADLKNLGCILCRIASVEDLRNAMWTTPRWVPLSWLRPQPEQVLALAMRELNMEKFENYLSKSSPKASEIVEVIDPQLKLPESYRRALNNHKSSEDALAEERRIVKEKEKEIKRASLELIATQSMAAHRLTILTELRNKVADSSAIENSVPYKIALRLRSALRTLRIIGVSRKI